MRKTILGSALHLLGVPYVVQLHGGGFGRYLAGLSSVRKRHMIWCLDRAERVVVLGSVFESVLSDELGSTRMRIRVIPNGVPAAIAAPSVATTDRTERLEIVHLGRLSEGKGTFLLLSSLSRLRDSEIPWHLTLAGDGDHDEVATKIEQLGLADRVTLLGWQSRASMNLLLATADIFVLPSKAEAMSLALLEAMSHGIPSITTDVGTHRFVVDDGRAGILVSFDETSLSGAILELIRSPDRRRSIGAAALDRFSDHFDIERCSGSWEDVYENAIVKEART